MELRINQDKYDWLFQVADVHKPIIGADFLRAHNLLVDLKNKRLLRADNLTVIKGVIKEVPVGLCNIMSLTEENELATLLKNRPELTTPTFTLEAPKHGVKDFIPTNDPPVYSQAQRLSPEKLLVAKDEFKTLVELGIARRSNSPYSSPLHLAPKPGGNGILELISEG